MQIIPNFLTDGHVGHAYLSTIPQLPVTNKLFDISKATPPLAIPAFKR